MRGFSVGLGGGIGSGKSAAADRFAELGAAVIDADVISHELTGPGGAAMPAIEQAFGAEAMAADGSLDRAAMRRLVFADASRRAQLEAILHPMIRAVSDARRDAAIIAGAPYAVMVIPLLIESGNHRDRFDRIAIVDCSEALQVKRVMARSGLAAAEVAAILAAQASRQARLAIADDVIHNDADLETLRTQVGVLHAKYCALADKMRDKMRKSG
ncbi:dephospho-CoA kinase [Georgfuchsia toluolica]|uniref:Dephospho-CoA kinase n=1 Tax=Georgfuchsia toluolica TaxID=424218 RepID=A0A916J5Z4_9PROT|nr:dephospho-CoA kinase [Georgfuchsia toluolica]CAG4884566.1 dephospho-CoA kinase [Georgfuchsia toluolica]